MSHLPELVPVVIAILAGMAKPRKKKTDDLRSQIPQSSRGPAPMNRNPRSTMSTVPSSGGPMNGAPASGGPASGGPQTIGDRDQTTTVSGQPRVRTDPNSMNTAGSSVLFEGRIGGAGQTDSLNNSQPADRPKRSRQAESPWSTIDQPFNKTRDRR